MPLKRAMTKSKRMWGVFVDGELWRRPHDGCMEIFALRRDARGFIGKARPVTVTWSTPSKRKQREINK